MIWLNMLDRNYSSWVCRNGLGIDRNPMAIFPVADVS
jgi:hypothetical protein